MTAGQQAHLSLSTQRQDGSREGGRDGEMVGGIEAHNSDMQNTLPNRFVITFCQTTGLDFKQIPTDSNGTLVKQKNVRGESSHDF